MVFSISNLGEFIMAVQKSRVTRSKRDRRRSHDHLTNPTVSLDKTTGEAHRRHHITASGFYRGKQVVVLKRKKEKETESES